MVNQKLKAKRNKDVKKNKLTSKHRLDLNVMFVVNHIHPKLNSSNILIRQAILKLNDNYMLLYFVVFFL